MKKIPLLIATFLFVITGYSQTYQDEMALIQSVYGMQKKEIVSEFVELSDQEVNDFWNLYNEYELKRKELGKDKFTLLTNYVNDYGDVSPADAEIFMKKAIALRKDSEKLIDSYYKKIKKKTDPVTAMQFYQMEHYLSDLIRLELLESIYTTKN